MTCKDCLYSDLCVQNGTMMYYQHKGKQLMEDAEKACPWKMFKNKADYAEVKHGEWILDKKITSPIFLNCSLCGNTADKDIHGNYIGITPYCSMCGAKMDNGVCVTDTNVGSK